MGGCPRDTAHRHRSGDHLWGLDLYLYHIDPGCWTQVFGSTTGTESSCLRTPPPLSLKAGLGEAFWLSFIVDLLKAAGSTLALSQARCSGLAGSPPLPLHTWCLQGSKQVGLVSSEVLLCGNRARCLSRQKGWIFYSESGQGESAPDSSGRSHPEASPSH